MGNVCQKLFHVNLNGEWGRQRPQGGHEFQELFTIHNHRKVNPPYVYTHLKFRDMGSC